MKRNIILAALLVMTLQTAFAQEEAKEFAYIYRISLTDKNGAIGLDNPLELLSQKALDRRQRQGLMLDESDRPVNPKYVKKIQKLAQVIGTSRWMNTVLVRVTDTTVVDKIMDLKFVSGAHKV